MDRKKRRKEKKKKRKNPRVGPKSRGGPTLPARDVIGSDTDGY
jgi:hypothetical protein